MRLNTRRFWNLLLLLQLTTQSAPHGAVSWSWDKLKLRIRLPLFPLLWKAVAAAEGPWYVFKVFSHLPVWRLGAVGHDGHPSRCYYNLFPPLPDVGRDTVCRHSCSSEMVNAMGSAPDKWVPSGIQGCSAVGAGTTQGSCSPFFLPSPYHEDVNCCEQTAYYEMSKD